MLERAPPSLPPRTMPRKRFSVISATEATRALYVDCEGFANKPPSLIGILCEDDFRQVVLDPALAPAANAKGLTVQSLCHVVADLVCRCRTEGRLLVGYSLHELDLFRTYGGADCYSLYCDAKRVATRWWNKNHPEARREDRSLKSFLADINYELPRCVGVQKATARLRAVLDGLAKHKQYARLTKVTKAKWTM